MAKIKRILQGESARLKAKEGIDLVADIIKVTLGPKGRNSVLKTLGPVAPRIVNDGVTIAREIQHEDCFINAGVEMAREICQKTNDVAGDGTTSTALLAQAIINEGYKRLITGDNPIDIKNELEKDADNLIKELKTISKPVDTRDLVKNIATISANNDDKVGESIAEIFDKVGYNASILVDKSSESELRVETVKGMYFDKGWKAPAFINSPHAKSIFNDANIFVTDKKLNWVGDIEEFFNNLVNQGIDKIVIIADEIEGEALNTLCVTNKSILMGGDGLHILGIDAPEFGPTREEILEDICIMTGAKLISDKNGLDFTVNPSEVVGSCEKIVSDSKSTTIVGGKGSPEAINLRISDLKAQIDQLGVTEKTTREKFEKRLSILESGVGIIYAGGATEIESKERHLRLEDAILATKSAIKSGYVAGGGYTYLALSNLATNPILREALKEPLKQVARNAGKSPESILEKVVETGKGWNARTDEYGDLEEMGVLDATLVVETVIRNAVSLAGLFLTTESLVVEDLKEDNFKPNGK